MKNKILILSFFLSLIIFFMPKVSSAALDWNQANENGYGLPLSQGYSWSMESFNGYLYADASGDIVRCSQSSDCNEALDWEHVGQLTGYIYSLQTADDYLYAGDNNGGVHRCSVASGCDEDSDWNQVNINGFNNVNNIYITSMKVITISGTDYLYAGTYNSTDGTRIYRCDNSNCDENGDWTQVNDNGFGVDNTYRSIESMIVSDEYLYVGLGMSATTSFIYKCSLLSGCDEAGDWEVANGMGFSSNTDVESLVEYSNYLYASTRDGVPGPAQIYRCSLASNCNELSDWSLIIDDGFGDASNNEIIMENFNNNLYAATRRTSEDGGAGVFYCDSSSGCNESVDWSQVNTDGFGDSNNGGIKVLMEFDNQLYATVENTTDDVELWVLIDETDPTVSDQYPSNSATGISRNTNISVSVHDADLGVDSSTIHLTIEGNSAISGGDCKSGYSCSINTDGSGGYDITVNSDTDFNYLQEVNVSVSVTDNDGDNSINSPWLFNIESEPVVDDDDSEVPDENSNDNSNDNDSSGDDDSSDEATSDETTSDTGGVNDERTNPDTGSSAIIDLNPKILTISGSGEETRLWAYDRKGNQTGVKIESGLFPSSYTDGAGIVSIDENHNLVRDQFLFFARGNLGSPQARVMGLRSDGSTVLKGQMYAFQAPGDETGKSSIKSGLSMVAGDFDNDGYDDDDAVACLVGNYEPHVKIFKDVTGIDNWELINQFTIPDVGPVGCNLSSFQYDNGIKELVITPHHGPSQPNVYIYTIGGTLKKQFTAYGPGVTNGLTPSGIEDRIYVTPNNGTSHVQAFDLNGQVKNFWWAYDLQDSRGNYVVRGDFKNVSGDIDLDGKDEILISPIGANGPQILAFETTGKWRTWPNFFAFDDEKLRNGVGIAVIENWHGENE